MQAPCRCGTTRMVSSQARKAMPPAHFNPAVFSLVAMLVWGTSDFLGGYASRRANAYLFTLLTHVSALSVGTAASLTRHAAFPDHRSVLWCLLAGAFGGCGLALFYRALSSGQMGLTAPLAAVLGAAIPALFGVITDGWPGKLVVAGFVLAALGIWLIARPEAGGYRAQGIGTAMLAGTGFALFYLCVHQAGISSALWSATVARSASLTVVLIIVVLGGHLEAIALRSAALALITGTLDVSGTMMFIHASQIGRLDAAVVLSSLYPAVTVLLARLVLREHLTRWKVVGMLTALAAVPLITAR
jgi:drug/metabolite transporter (DMT)-like permease